jgi:ketosteroid isomerase-like protein
MSQENVDVVRRAAEAAMRRPEPDWETVNQLYAPDHQFISLISPLDGEAHQGARGFRDWLESVEAVGEWESRIEDVRAGPDGRIVVIARFRQRTRRAGIPFDQRTGAVVTVRDGLIRRTEAYPTPEDALEAVGLRE